MTMRELKSGNQYIKALDPDSRTVTGIFSVFGNIDSYGDIMMPGSFSKTIRERGPRIVHLWQHDLGAPPTARITSLRELSRDELPPALLRDHPEAQGAAEVTREYLPTPRADEILAALRAEVPLQMSFAFQTVKYDYGEQDQQPVRYVREVRLFETSDVNFGANEATMAVRGALPLGVLLEQLKRHAEQLQQKGGARHSAADTAMIDQIHDLACDLGTTVCMGKAPKGLDPGWQQRSEARRGQAPVSVTGIWLRGHGDLLQVLAEVDGQWRLLIKEHVVSESELSHIIEPLGILQAPADPLIDPEAESRAATALTLQRRSRAINLALRIAATKES